MRKYIFLSADLFWAFASGFLAVFLRDNLEVFPDRMASIVPLAAVTLIAAAIVFVTFGLHRGIWRYASLPDLMRIMAAVSITLLIVLFFGFAHNRLEGVARSIPLIQWVVMVGAMIGMRALARLIRARRVETPPGATPPGAKSAPQPLAPKEQVLVVGLSQLTELYIRALDEFAPGQISIVGIVAEGEQLKGRRMHSLEVLGTPQEIEQVLAVQSVHGVEISRIIVTLPFEKFSKRSQKALLATERASNIKLDFFAERLGLINPGDDAPGSAGEPAGGGESASEDTLDLSRDLSRLGKHDFAALGLYSYAKRVIDIIGAVLIFVLLMPLIQLVALAVLIDVGLPLTFHQQRPGRLGHSFRLYKFRTMRAAHDEKGRRIPDQNRESAIGRLIRRWHLDEFPQLYNIIKGEMSFVGPRPLLPVDQPDGDTSRLLMRPGLTGWAQINGGREISIPDKNALDLWYLVHASLWLDVKIMLATFATLLRGERNNRQAIARAWEAIRQLEARVGAAAVQESVKNMQEDGA